MAAPAFTPPVSPGAPLAMADHDLVGRIARVWVLQHRPIANGRELARLLDELDGWHSRTRELLARRFGDHEVADWFDDAVGPLVEPPPTAPLSEQVEMVRGQAAIRLRWLSELRSELPERLPRASALAGWRAHPASTEELAAPVAVLRPVSSSSTAAAVESALEALGDDQPVVISLDHDLAGLDQRVPLGAVAVVIIEREPRTHHPSTASLIALGWANGALGRERVLAVLAPMVDDQPALEGYVVVPAKVRARWRAEVVAWAAAASRPD